MPLYMVFNDASVLRWDPRPFECKDAIAKVAAAIKGVADQRGDSVLLTPRGWGAVYLDEGKPLTALLNANADRDDVRALLGAQNRSAIDGEEILESALLGWDCSLDGAPSEAAAIQAIVGGAFLTIPTSGAWAVDWLRNSVIELGDDEGIYQRDLNVRNFFHGESPKVHLEYLRTNSFPTDDGEELWQKKEDFLPRLHFLSRVREQLVGLGRVELSSVVERLVELQATLDEWATSEEVEPRWRSHVTNEHEGRRRKCHFTDGDGASHCYEIHARFTPGAGRIHFRLLGQSKSIEVAHIGGKIQ